MAKAEKQKELDQLRIVSAEMAEYVQERRQELITWITRHNERALYLGRAAMEGEPLNRTEFDESLRMVNQKFEDVLAAERAQKEAEEKIAAAVLRSGL